MEFPVTQRTERAEPCARFEKGKSQVTPFARLICDHAGALFVPVFERYLVAEVFFASFDKTVPDV